MNVRWPMCPVLVFAALATLVGGCGGASENGMLSSGTAAALHRDVVAVRGAAAAEDRQAALEALDALQARVRRADADGELSDAERARFRTLVSQTRQRVLAEIPAATPMPQTPAPQAPAAPPATGNGNDGNEGKGDDRKDQEKDKEEKQGDEGKGNEKKGVGNG